MFWTCFSEICRERGTTPNGVCSAIGLSNAVATHWKNGTLPKADVLEKIADYFDISVDSLLGRQTKTPPEVLALRATREEWTELLNSMTDENLIRLRDYAKLLLLQQAQADQEGQESHG